MAAAPSMATVETGHSECCRTCELAAGVSVFERKFIVCSKCGNKRCPKAEYHGYVCSGSNELGQMAELEPLPVDAEAMLAAIEPALTDEAILAQRDRALDILDALLPLIPPSAFAWPAAQESLHAANALLAELGRGKPDDRAVIVQAWLDARAGR